MANLHCSPKMISCRRRFENPQRVSLSKTWYKPSHRIPKHRTEALRAPNSLNNRRLHNRSDRSEEKTFEQWPKACPAVSSSFIRLPGRISYSSLRHLRSRSALPVRFSPHWKSRRLQSAPLFRRCCFHRMRGSSGSQAILTTCHIDHDGRGDRLRRSSLMTLTWRKRSFPQNPDQLHQDRVTQWTLGVFSAHFAIA